MNIRGSILSAAVAAMSFCTLAAAQDARPTTGESGTERPQVVSPRWNQPRAEQSQQQPAAAETPRDAEQLLATTVLAVPQAHADAVVARWTYRRLDSDLNRTTMHMRQDFRDSEEYSGAVANLRAAHAAYDQARATATRDIQSTDEYQAALSLRQDVSEQIASEHDQQEPDAERLVALAELKVNYIAPMRSAERAALDGSSDVRSARERLMDVAQRVARMERDFAHDTRDSIELTGLRRLREDARIGMLASSVYLTESRVARSIALDYAYYARSVDRYIPRLTEGYGYRGGYGGFGTYGGGGLYTGGFGIRTTIGD